MKVTIEWVDGSTSYYSVGTYPAPVGTIQHVPSIMQNSLTVPGSIYGEHRQTEFSFTVNDQLGDIWEKRNNFRGSKVTVRDGQNVLLATLYIISLDFPTGNTAAVRASSAWAELGGETINPDYLVSTDFFPGAPVVDEGEERRYAFFSGPAKTSSSAGINSLQAWRTEAGPGAKYIVGEAGAITVGKMPAAPDSVLDPDGNSLAGYTFSNIGNIFYVSKAAAPDFDYVSVNFTLTGAHTLQDVFDDVGTKFFATFQFGPTAGDVRNYFDDLYLNPIPGREGTFNDPHIYIAEATTGPKLLNSMCSPWLSYRLKPNGKIVFDALLPDFIDEKKTGYPWELSRGFSSVGGIQRDDRYVNQYETTHGIQAGTGEGEETRLYRWFEGVSRNSGKAVEVRSTNITTSQNGGAYPFHIGWNQSKIRFAQVVSQPTGFTFELMPVDGYNLNVFDYIYFSHDVSRGEFVLYVVTKLTYDWSGNKLMVEVLDWSHTENQDNEQRFLFQSQPLVGNSDIFPNCACNGWAIPSDSYGDARHTLGGGKYTAGHWSLDGTQGKAWGTANYAEAWQIDGDFLWYAWVRIADNQVRVIAETCGDVNNCWDFRIRADGKPAFLMVQGGVTVVNFVANSTVPLNAWALLVFVKSGSDAGWYIDGSQDSHHTWTHVIGTYPFSGPVWIGYSSRADAGYEFDISEVAIYRNDTGPLLNQLSPVAGLTDSFPLPTGAVTSRRGVFIDYS